MRSGGQKSDRHQQSGPLARRDADPILVFLDLETGGLQTWRPIIQIAAVAVDSAFRELEAFEAKVRFSELHATARTLRRRHYDRAIWKREARTARDVAADFSRFLMQHAKVSVSHPGSRPFAVAQLVAHNADFDGPFLRAWFKRQGSYLPSSYRVLCTVHRAMWFFQENPALPPPRDYKLGTLCRYFGVSWNPSRAHEALADVRSTVGLYRAIMEYRSRPVGMSSALGRLAV